NENSKRVRVESTLSSARAEESDGQGQLRRVTDDLGNFIQLDRDPGGRITQSHEYSAGTAITPPQTLTTSYEYDASDRLTAVVDPAGGRTEADYDSTGEMVELRVPGESPKRFSYDGLGRVTRTEADLTPAVTAVTMQ